MVEELLLGPEGIPLPAGWEMMAKEGPPETVRYLRIITQQW